MKNFYDIEYIPTGLVYNIEKTEAQRLLTEEPENFRLADKVKLELPKTEEPESTIQELVMEKEEEPKEEVKTEKKSTKKAKTKKSTKKL